MAKIIKEAVIIADLDRSIARSVRVEPEKEAVERYAESYNDTPDAMPPVEVFRGDKTDFLADGEHRCLAKESLKVKKIEARIWPCKDDAEARRKAKLHAAGSNVAHGLPRSNDAKRMAVISIITDPTFETESDRVIAGICKTYHYYVSTVRQRLQDEGKLTGKAVRTYNQKKRTATKDEAKPEPHTEGRKDTEEAVKEVEARPVPPSPSVSTKAPEPDARPAQVVKAEREMSHAEWRSRTIMAELHAASPKVRQTLRDAGVDNLGQLWDKLEKNETFGLPHTDVADLCFIVAQYKDLEEDSIPFSAPAKADKPITAGPVANTTIPSTPTFTAPQSPTPKVKSVKDSKGRVIPASMVQAYEGSRHYAADVCRQVKVIEDEAEAHSKTLAGRGLIASTIRAAVKNIMLAVKGAAYYCVCPYVDDDGTHETGDHMEKNNRCKVCGNIGLLNEDQFKATPATVKRFIEQRSDDSKAA